MIHAKLDKDDVPDDEHDPRDIKMRHLVRLGRDGDKEARAEVIRMMAEEQDELGRWKKR